MYLFYSITLGMALAVTLPFWVFRMLTGNKYRAGLSQRLGAVPNSLRETRQLENCIWIHAVSVGEVLAISGLVQQLEARFPEWRIVVSTTTLTGQQLAQSKFGSDNVFYLPLDFVFALRPYFNRLRPRMLIVAETEFWPNLLHLARQNGTRVAVVNARISDRSFPRYRFMKSLLHRVLANVDIFLTQSETDRERLIAIGADGGRAQVSGNLKFDVTSPVESEIVERLRKAIAPGTPIIVCGSTVEGEEEMLLDAFQSLLVEGRTILLLLAPRHPERFDSVAALLSSRRMPFLRRSEWKDEPIKSGVILLDTIGELAATYQLADFAFVGGSLVPRGGHNILEPAQFGTPISVGIFTDNFRDMLQIFEREDAVKRVGTDSLLPVWKQWLDSPEIARAMGLRGQKVFRNQSGATKRTLDALEVLLWMPSTLKDRLQKVTP